MEVAIIFGSVIVLHTLFYYLDGYLKETKSTKYAIFLNAFPIQVDFMSLKWTTSMFNKALSSWTIGKLKLLHAWYKVGTAATLLLCIPSMILLTSTAFVSFENMRQHKKEEAVLQPVLPGINLPKSDLPFYFLTLLVCTVVHEMGHAVAAVSEQIPLATIGFMLWFIIPAAFVELPTSNVNGLSHWRQLKIYCAGVWHNIILAALAYIILMLLPVILMPLFQTGAGVYVVNLNEYSTVGGHDFQIGDHLTRINDCRITDAGSWNQCLTAVLRESSSGFCVTNSYFSGIQAIASDQPACCNDSELSQSHLCFLSFSELPKKNHYCLRAREVATISSAWCRNDKDCTVNQSCLKPSFRLQSENETDSSSLILVKRNNADSILFVGQPDVIYLSVHVSNYVPRTFLGPQFINCIDHLLRYIVSFSAGLALLNVVPCMYMDGQHIVNALSEIVFEGRNISMKRQILRALIFIGTFLVVVNLTFGMFALFL
uniref:Membrane-bound transcription factor site-2 protease n=1 Tax=Ceriodaphnia reticulata TaxID=302197 RepID=A0A4Y7LXA4_9CRUS|nr:EOG090X08FA [Ceriodaphnia reticulata]